MMAALFSDMYFWAALLFFILSVAGIFWILKSLQNEPSEDSVEMFSPPELPSVEKTVRIAAIHAPAGIDLPLDPAQNTATLGLLTLIRELKPDHGFEVTLRKGIALGSGMGGSAA